MPYILCRNSVTTDWNIHIRSNGNPCSVYAEQIIYKRCYIKSSCVSKATTKERITMKSIFERWMYFYESNVTVNIVYTYICQSTNHFFFRLCVCVFFLVDRGRILVYLRKYVWYYGGVFQTSFCSLFVAWSAPVYPFVPGARYQSTIQSD